MKIPVMSNPRERWHIEPRLFVIDFPWMDIEHPGHSGVFVITKGATDDGVREMTEVSASGGRDALFSDAERGEWELDEVPPPPMDHVRDGGRIRESVV